MIIEIEQRGRKLVSFKKIVEKAVMAKAKSALKSHSYTCETNEYCAQGSRLVANKSYA